MSAGATKRLLEPSVDAERAMWTIRSLYGEIEQVVDALEDPVTRLQVASFLARFTQPTSLRADYRDAKGKIVKVDTHTAYLLRVRGAAATALLKDRTLSQVAALAGSTKATMESLMARYERLGKKK